MRMMNLCGCCKRYCANDSNCVMLSCNENDGTKQHFKIHDKIAYCSKIELLFLKKAVDNLN